MVKLTPIRREVLQSIRDVNNRRAGLGALFHPGFEDALDGLVADGFAFTRINGYFITAAGRSALKAETQEVGDG